MLLSLRNYLSTLSGRKRIVLVLTLILFIISGSSFSYAAYVYFQSTSLSPLSPDEGGAALSPVDFFGRAAAERLETPDSAKVVPHPLNGVLFTESEAKDWQSRRALAVTINNHVDARPQWGLSFADIIYEAVAEGGISRFLAIYHSYLPDKVGPVRSARRYYVDWAKEYDAWYAHWGGASTANEANVYDYMRKIYVSSIDVPGIGPNEPFDRDPERLKKVGIEHTAFARLPLVYEAAYRMYPDQVRPFRPIKSWKFKDDVASGKRPSASSVEFNFWDLPDFVVKWEYDPKTDTYIRFQGGEEQVDALTNEPLRAKNVIVIFMEEKALLDEKAHLLYKTLGSGDAKIFLDGKVVEATWERSALSFRTLFFDSSQSEITFNRGQVWIEVLPTGTTLTYN